MKLSQNLCLRNYYKNLLKFIKSKLRYTKVIFFWFHYIMGAVCTSKFYPNSIESKKYEFLCHCHSNCSSLSLFLYHENFMAAIIVVIVVEEKVYEEIFIFFFLILLHHHFIMCFSSFLLHAALANALKKWKWLPSSLTIE